MTDRLQHLLRQRAQLQEHLAWLDREIAEAKGSPTPLTANESRPVARPSIPPPLPATPAANDRDEAETILGRYNLDAQVTKTDARRSFLILFAISMVVFILGIAISYYFYGRHLGRWW